MRIAAIEKKIHKTKQAFYQPHQKIITTHFSETFYRFTGYPDIIESSGRRISYRYSYNKRFNPVSREWLTENDLSQWINFLPGPGGKIQIQALDVPAPPAAAPLS